MAGQTRTIAPALGASSTTRLLPALDVGLAVLAGAIWYVRPQEGAWPLALIAVAWLLRLVVYGEPTRATPFDLPLLIFLASAFAAVNLGFNQGQQWLDNATPLMWGWAKYWSIVAAVALFFAVANLRGIRQTWSFVRVYVLLGVVVTLYFIATNDWQARAGKFDLLTQLGLMLSEPLPEVPGRRLHPNVVGGLIAMLVPFGFALLAEARARRREFVAWGALLLVMLFGLLMSASRGAWLADALVLLAWALWREWSGGRSRSRLRLVLLACVALVGAVVAASMVDLGTIAISTGAGGSSVISRFSLWQGGWSLAQDYFFTGAGLGTVALSLSTYVLLVPVFFIVHTHNVLLDIFVEQGIVGLLAFGWLLALVGMLALRGVRQLAAQHTQQAMLGRWLLEAALASMAVTLIHGQVDDVAYGSRALLLLFVPAGMVAALCARLPEMRVRLRRSWLAVALALLLVAAFWQRSALLAQWYANLGALSQARIELGLYHAPDRLPESVRREADMHSAQDEFTRALSADGANRTAAQRLAMIALARGQYEAARAELEPLNRRDGADNTTRQLLGDADLALGRLDDAFALWLGVDDAESRLRLEADVRYGDDPQRAAWARQLADRIHAAR